MEEIITLGEFRNNNLSQLYEVWDEVKNCWVDYKDSSYNQMGPMPDPHNPEDPINLITLCDSLSNHYYSWGTGPYKPKDSNVTYVQCKSERDLLQKFLNFWSSDHPDVLATWNGEGFDVPYIMNRLGNLLGEEETSRMSPVNSIYYRENVAMNKFGKMINRWYIRGVSNIDYMEVYKTFSRGDRESYSLNYIGEHELGEGKTDVGGQNLASLSEENWELFVDYNIQDVKLLVKLDEKLKFIKLIRALSYKGFIPFEQSLGKVSMITGAVAHQAVIQGYRIPTFKNDGLRDEYVGGYVHEPERGLSNAVVSYDANSLYPNTIITLNISPETKIGRIIEVVGGEYTIRLANEKTITIDKEKFDRLVQKEQLAISKYNVLYTQKFKGVVPNLINRVYGERVSIRAMVSKLMDQVNETSDPNAKIELEAEILNLDTIQNVLKLILNSIYGVFAQKYSPLFDIEHSASITLTGQAVAKQASEIAYQFAKDKGVTEDKKKIYIYGDTDSCYFSIAPILSKLNAKLLENNKLTSKAREVLAEIDVYLNDRIIEWAAAELKSIDPRFVFKQEAVCDVAFFQEKKRYILHVIEQEGKIPKKPFKYVGVEVARSTISRPVKNLIMQVIENAMLAQDKKKADEIFRKAYDEFCTFKIEDASIRSKISDYEKYEARIGEMGQTGKGTPIGPKAGISYNNLLKKLKLEHKYEPIGSGKKIKYFYTSRNNYNYKVMGFNESYPPELKEVVGLNYQFMFEKILAPPIQRFYDGVGWILPTPGREVQTDLFDLFQ